MSQLVNKVVRHLVAGGHLLNVMLLELSSTTFSTNARKTLLVLFIL